MAFIEYNNIENMSGSSNSFGWAYTLIGVTLGFGLNACKDWWLKRRDVLRAGEIFETELEILKINIVEQVDYLEEYHGEVSTSEFSDVVIVLTHNIDFIKSIDAFKLIKYYEITKVEKYNEILSSQIKNFEIMKSTMLRLENNVINYEGKFPSLLLELEHIFDDFLIQFKKYSDEEAIKGLENEELEELRTIILDFISKSKETGGIPGHLEADFLKKLTNISFYNDPHHPFYGQINLFDLKYTAELNKIDDLRDTHLYGIEAVEDTLKDIYESLYDEDFPKRKKTD